MKRFLVAISLITFATVSGVAEEMLNLAVRGQAPAYTIVTPARASDAERYAAEELQSFLGKVTGQTLPIATDATPLPVRAILVGSTAHTTTVLKEPSFEGKTLGEGVLSAGDLPLGGVRKVGAVSCPAPDADASPR